ncbi:General stress protein 39 [Anatilimnocola aggregata]|uniref:General stress protein 39 n=1 Tax=Anatilimnocola aggregata TaxID=2528021 RepID=A0A517Y8C0_9BACT|nr:SDR family oxidoreductase [Anatilimnocola aggregata]QDU26445.1 General stress protein 39 [Anatilimnocola aggregata]
MTDRKVALITGSGKQRVGWHVAEALGARGYSLAIHYRTSAQEAAETVKEFRSRGWEANAFAGDLADETAVKKLMADVLSEYGQLDALVHTAAIWQPKKLEEVTAADVRHYLEVNTLATFLCCQHAGLAMVKQATGGCLVTFGDWATIRPYLNYAAYFPSKGAIPALTRTFAVELAHRNPRVRVNCIQPGPVMLPAELPEAERAAAIAGTLVKREGTPQHVAQAVLHFLENDFLTGVCLPVDGGRSVFAGTGD